jgi:hypothetical protein
MAQDKIVQSVGLMLNCAATMTDDSEPLGPANVECQVFKLTQLEDGSYVTVVVGQVSKQPTHVSEANERFCRLKPEKDWQEVVSSFFDRQAPGWTASTKVVADSMAYWAAAVRPDGFSLLQASRALTIAAAARRGVQLSTRETGL